MPANIEQIKEVMESGDNVGHDDVHELIAELEVLRLIVTEKFAGADFYVKAEDAADVALWVHHPWAARLLILDRDTAYNGEWGGGCRICNASWDEWTPEHHESACKYVEALTLLQHWKLPLVAAAQERYDAALARETIAEAAPEEPEPDHFADQTTRELHDSNYDEYGREIPRPDPFEDDPGHG